MDGKGSDGNIKLFFQYYTRTYTDFIRLRKFFKKIGQYLDGRPPGKTRLLLFEVLVRPAGGAHPVVCVGPNAPV